MKVEPIEDRPEWFRVTYSIPHSGTYTREIDETTARLIALAKIDGAEIARREIRRALGL